MTDDDEAPSGRPTGEKGEGMGPNKFSPSMPAFRRARRQPLLRRISPVSAQMRGYRRLALRHDLLAGLTVAAVAIPSAMAYAELAGLSPVAGLYALLLPAIAYALLGSSRQLSIGPDAALALLVGVALAPMAVSVPEQYAALAALIAILAGACYYLVRFLRLGWIADYFSKPVLVGYIHGIVIVLMVGQLEKILGLSIAAEEPLPQLWEITQGLETTSLVTLAVALISLASLIVLRHFPKVPAALLVVVAGITASGLLSLDQHGVETVGHIPAGLPSFSMPDVTLADAVDLIPAALAVFAVGFADSILTARSFAGRKGQHVKVDQELVALGSANVSAGITGAFPVAASGSRTAVNEESGGRTQLVGIIAAAATALVLLVLTAPVALLPKACLGAVIVIAAYGLVDPDAWRALSAAGRGQVAIAVVTLLGVITVGVVKALVIAVALSIIDTVRVTASPNDAVLGYVERLGRYANTSLHPSARLTPGVVVYRLDDRLFFANADYFRARVLEALAGAPSTTDWLVLDAESIADIDATGVGSMELLLDELDRRHISFMVARIKSPLLARFDATGLTDRIGKANFEPTVQRAVATCVDRISRKPTP